MKIEEYLEKLKFVPCDEASIIRVEKRFSTTLPDDVKRVLALAQTGEFLEGKSFCRKLSLDDIFDANAELNLDFVQKRIIPFFEKGDNDYIVFNLKKGRWELFNIVDEISFKARKDLEPLLQ